MCVDFERRTQATPTRSSATNDRERCAIANSDTVVSQDLRFSRFTVQPVETTPLSSVCTRLVVRLAKERDGFELIATVNALPEIRCSARSVFKPYWCGNQTTALRTRILVGQIIRYGSDHDASPICFFVCEL
jgi:hypothetical protein